MSAPYEERLDVLRERVEEQEEELRASVVELENVARRRIDARNWIRSQPFVWTVGAFLVGAWLGGRRT